MGEHYIEKCACGIIVSQCRCPEGFGEKKSIRIVKCTHPNPPVTDAYTKEAVEWMNAPTGPMPNLAMTDARREPMSLKNIETLLNIADGPSRMASQAARNQIVSSYRALADRLAASEELNRVAELGMSEMEAKLKEVERERKEYLQQVITGVYDQSSIDATVIKTAELTALRQQLADAQATIATLHGRLSSAITAHHTAGQQVARLRAKLKELGYEDETLY